MRFTLPGIYSFIFCLLFGMQGSYAQQPDTITPWADSMIITRKIEVLKVEQDLDIDSILHASALGKFKHYSDKSIVFQGWDPYYYWFRFTIRNTDSTDKDLFLLMGHNSHMEALLYQKKDTGWGIIGKSGIKYSFTEQAYPYLHHLMPITIKANSTETFFLKYDFRFNYKTFVFALVTPKKLHQISMRIYFLFGLLLGLMLLFFILNLYLYYSLKEKIHLWYAAYILAVVFLLLRYEGLDKQFLWMDSVTANRLTPVQAAAAVTLFLQMHVIQMFLSNIRKDEWLYKITSFLKFNLLISGIVHVIIFYLQMDYRIESVIFEWSNKSLSLSIIAILVNCVVSYARKFKPAALILLGTIVFLIGGLEKLLFLENVSYTFPPSLFQVGLVIETAILSFALMYRYNTFKKEKELLQAELARQNNQAAQNILMAQENERKRIAEDLHDDIGSSLAVLKLRLQNMKIDKKDLDELTEIVDKASADTRNISHNLMPPEFEKTSLPDILHGYYHRLNKETNTRFLFISRGYDQRFEKNTELMIYRIITEITKNILKHSGATEATIQLIYEEDGLEIMAEDNGMGIKQTQNSGIGLKNISSRVNYINGEMQIDSGKHGTTIIINVPNNL